MKRTLLITTISLLIAGCASSGVQVAPEQVAAFKEGVATEADVVKQLGRPTSATSGAYGKVLIYSYSHAQARPASFIPIVGALAGGADSRATTAIFRFNTSGVLVSKQSTTSEYGTGTGFAAGAPIQQTDQPRQ